MPPKNRKAIKASMFALSLALLFLAGLANAQSATLARTFSTTTPMQGSTVTITLTLTAQDIIQSYVIHEEIPIGFTISNNDNGATSGNSIEWAFFDSTATAKTATKTYTINVPSTLQTGSHQFSNGWYTALKQGTVYADKASSPTDTITVTSATATCTDSDNDSYGAIGTDLSACTGSTILSDCNDANASINPNAVEACDNIDNDCDRLTDEFLNCTPTTSQCIDYDNDGYGTGSDLSGCAYAVLDCNDSNSSINPSAAETCDNVDNDCDNSIDEAVTRICGIDTGACQTGIQPCTLGAWGNCTEEIIPTTETCNNIDDDCDGLTDDGISCPSLAQCSDGDFDNYGATGTDLSACTGSNTTPDCDDANPTINPGAIETCNNTDDNCDGSIDETLSCKQTCQEPLTRCTLKAMLGENIKFYVGGVPYAVSVQEITYDFAIFKVASESVKIAISDGKSLDVTKDGKKDITLIFNGILNNNTVELTIAKYSEGAQIQEAACTDNEQNQGEEGIDCGGPCKPCKGPSSILIIAAAAVLTLIIAFALLHFIKGKKEGKETETEGKANIEKLKKFAKTCLEKGYTKEQIENVLSEEGMPSDVIEKVLEDL